MNEKKERERSSSREMRSLVDRIAWKCEWASERPVAPGSNKQKKVPREEERHVVAVFSHVTSIPAEWSPFHMSTGGTSPPKTISKPPYPSTYATARRVSISVAAATRANTAIMPHVVAILLTKLGTSIIIRNGSSSAIAEEIIANQRRSAPRQGERGSGAYGRRAMCFSKSTELGSLLALEDEGDTPPLRAMRPPSSRSWASRRSVVEIRKGLLVGLGREAAVEVM